MKKYELMPILMSLKALLEKGLTAEAIDLIDRILKIEDDGKEVE